MTEASPLTRYQLAELGALLAEPARAAILLALMDGTTRPAGELAQIAGVSAATASAHLKRLLDGGLLSLHEQGRHRYFRLANDDVAAWLEGMALPHAARTAPIAAARDPALCRARTCYRHLAGQLGVALCEAWLERGWLHAGGDGMSLSPAAADALVQAGWQAAPTQQLLRLHGRSCLDWTERRLHLGGPLGVAITSAMLDAGWLRRVQRNRALLPTQDGLRRFAELGVRLDD
ncbi:ArsR/SmtB family transcription factor [Dyella caseinilytica]|uniref:Helix-turn-helix transcriptional regulator n=1 Tax=Dyella caseinilytica TaxID=1849581 RepID=A0ABX7GT98_9GAMM|nr:helix-turn-helix transcriptional regulator [Dyella caseinilytica]QRN53278.1 helix-turn-helix transcriptional regulator [Dyella caseinilytica]GGA12823.1 transcriptional regulator [Dyella caseinilytica]